MLTKEILGRRIAERRAQAGLTQEQLATALGLERTAITRIESGRQGVDTLQLSALAEALGVSPVIFLEATEGEPIEVMLRAPEAQTEHVRRQLEWLDTFVRDYEFLIGLTPEVPIR